jgi:hypothetical protein
MSKVDRLKESLVELTSKYESRVHSIVGSPANRDHVIKFEFDFDQIASKVRNFEKTLNEMEGWSSFYVLCRIYNAFQYISNYYNDPDVDTIQAGIQSMIIRSSDEPGDGKKMTYEVTKIPGGKTSSCALYLALDCPGYNMCYDNDDLMAIICETGYANQMDKKLDMLKSMVESTRMYYTLTPLERVLGFFWQPSPAEADRIAKCDVHKQRVIASYPVTWIRKSGRRQDSILVLTSSRFWLFNAHGTKGEEHFYNQIVCFDCFPEKSVIPGRTGDLYLKVWSTEEEPHEEPLSKPMCPCGAPKINIPKPSMPEMPKLAELPSIDMPKLGLPSLPLPDVPSAPSFPEIDITNPFKREKKDVPPRYHPDCSQTKTFFLLRGKDDNLTKEIALVMYGMYHNSCRRDYPVYFTDYRGTKGEKALMEVPPKLNIKQCCSLQ